MILAVVRIALIGFRRRALTAAHPEPVRDFLQAPMCCHQTCPRPMALPPSPTTLGRSLLSCQKMATKVKGLMS